MCQDGWPGNCWRAPRHPSSRRRRRWPVGPLHLGWFMNFTPGRMGQPAGGRRLAVGRQVLRRHGAGAGARVLRLHHDRGHADGVRGLRRQRRGRAEARAAGAEARSDAARRADRRGDHAAGRRRHDVHAGLSAVHAGAALLDAGPHRRRPVRLEHRHLGRGYRRRRISASTSCRRASSATRWPTNTSIWSANCSTRGTRTRW